MRAIDPFKLFLQPIKMMNLKTIKLSSNILKASAKPYKIVSLFHSNDKKPFLRYANYTTRVCYYD